MYGKTVPLNVKRNYDMAFGPKTTAPKDDPISTGRPDEELASHDVAVIEGTQSIAVPVKQGAKRLHKATYARDKRNGGYLVRVIGPHANAFGGKIVPVLKRDDTESEEALEVVVWSGTDTGTPTQPGTGKPVALYTFTQKPKGAAEVEF